MKYLYSCIIVLVAFCNLGFSQDMEAVQIETLKISDHIYMLLGRGGNIGVSVGEDGVFVIDDQYAPLTPKILVAIKAISDKPIRFLANTHWHGDHTGGNSNMAKAGATIMAHTNVRKRLEETPLRDNSKRPVDALPIITFNDKMNLYFNGEQVAIFHLENAHTDGDAQIYFTQSNVLHTGDTFFKDRYPYIDLNSGGSIDGYISGVERSLMLIDEETRIIPGHGSLARKADYEKFLNMMKSVRSEVQQAIQNGKSEDEVAEDNSLTQKYDDQKFGDFFISGERFRRTVYQSLSKNRNTN